MIFSNVNFDHLFGGHWSYDHANLRIDTHSATLNFNFVKTKFTNWDGGR